MVLDNLSYGSDQSGLICGYLFAHGQAGKALHTNEALAWLQTNRAANDNSFIWLHFNLTNVAAEKWLHEHVSLPEEFYETLHEGSRSTRIEHADHNLIAVINDVLHDFAFEASDIATLWLSVTNNIMISARRKPLQSVDRLRNAVNHGEIFHSPSELLTHLLRDQADVLIGIVRNVIKKLTTSKIICWQIASTKNAPIWAKSGVCWCACNACWHPSLRPCSACCKNRRYGWQKVTCRNYANRLKNSRWC